MEYEKGVFGILNLENLTNEPLLLLDGGIESRFRELYFFDNSCRSDYSGYIFQYTLSGYGIYENGDNVTQIQPGMGFFTAIPHQSRYYLPKTATAPWEFLYLHFDGSAAAAFFHEIEIRSGGIVLIDIKNPVIQRALALQKRMINAGRLLPYEGGEFLYRFLCGLLRQQFHPFLPEKESIAGRAAMLMEKEYSLLSGVEEVAAKMNLSPEHLSRCFHSQLGISPIQYLNRLRVQSAMNDLLSSTDTIKAIALRNGFANGNYFSKVFRHYTGTSPSEYRRKKTGGESKIKEQTCRQILSLTV